MPVDRQRLIVGNIRAKYDRTYKAGDREGDAMFEVNVARLECTCPEFRSRCAGYPSHDARRVCAHIYDKLYATKVERTLDPIVQLFIRYGRGMHHYRVVKDALGSLVVGQPFGPQVIRAIGIANNKPVLATYDIRTADWAQGETELGPELAAAILARMRETFAEAFGNVWR